jgi:hypothetical protein
LAELELRSGKAIIERVPVDRVVDTAPAVRQKSWQPVRLRSEQVFLEL